MGQRQTPQVNDWVDVSDWQDVSPIPGVSSINVKGPVTEYTIEATGKTLPLPSAMPDSRVRQLIDGHIRAVTRGPDSRTAGQVAKEGLGNVAYGGTVGFAKGIAAIPETTRNIVTSIKSGDIKGALAQLKSVAEGSASPVTTPLKGALSGSRIPLGPFGSAITLPEYPEGNPADASWQQAQQGAGANLTGLGIAAIPKAVNAIPRTARAGVKFEQIMNKAKDVPLELTTADEAVIRARELRERGSTMPKVLRDFMKRREAGLPVTYEEGRDFASNASALSAREVTAMNAKMQRQVAQFAKAMKEANREAAASVGMGDLYDAAMKEYRQAKTLQEASKVLAKWGAKVAGAAAAYGAYRELTK